MADMHDAGYVRAKVENLERDMLEVKSDVKDIKDIVAKNKGALRVLATLVTAAAGVGALINSLFGKHS